MFKIKTLCAKSTQRFFDRNLPAGKKCTKLLLNGKETDFKCEQIEKSVYVNIETDTSANMMSIEILF